MAGKTFPGIGDLEDEAPPLDPADAADSSDNSQSHYSGPTVVDDVKVEQGLKKLRSLDVPLGPMTGIHQAIADVLADPARATPAMPVPADLLMPEITIDPVRGTAVGRSISGPAVGQQTTQPFDDRALRGTMFGDGVHLPDLEEARRAMLVETSKALAVVERGVPTTNEITVFQPGTYPQRAEIPFEHEPPPPRSNRFHAEDTPIELRTVLPRKTLLFRVAVAGACIAAIAVAALLWVRSADEADFNARAAALPVRLQPRPVEVQSLVAPTAPRPSTPAPQPAPMVPAPALAPPAPALAPPAPAAVPAGTKSTRPSSPAESTTRRPHAASSHTERHRSPASSEAAGGGTKPDEGPKPDKPDRPMRGKRPLEDDPDATMAPTIE